MPPSSPAPRFHPYKGHHKTPSFKPRAPTSHASGSGLSINDLKRRIRDIKRLLNHAELLPEARIVQERALAGYEKDLADETARRGRSEMIKKYHFVRFLDRKAATKELRRVTQLHADMQHKSKSNGADAAGITRKMHEAQINLNYTIYYPLDEKYISLYPQDKKKRKNPAEDDSDDGVGEGGVDADGAEKPPLWYVVEKCTADGTLDKLRNGRLGIGLDGKPKQQHPAATTKTAKTTEKDKSSSTTKHKESTTRKTAHGSSRRHGSEAGAAHQNEGEEDEGDDSDGGFFEV
ncbi:hypothetical protein BGW36DRAFT_385418 [Talaromyces proteolyticus]|uniref:rRNA-processing protein EFG1 n=1 Tax=Talaromyces proteolyticus TaxID=1131652 RepID=A0AAD4KPX6_9EURO|nr:uncharacterized protein BGW36DRAFT_385418 [Talaromyces proteolyticus]KAH8692889.1 hypothetical protein BGW36DRAFT_385418 [Talaromyces proteolyticus]